MLKVYTHCLLYGRSHSTGSDPENLQQLRSFLGLLNYCGKFIPNLTGMVHPLNQLLQKDAKWTWTPDCAEAFLATKQALNLSAHYDPSLPNTLAEDASAYGIGSVIFMSYLIAVKSPLLLLHEHSHLVRKTTVS